jgi:hypothetical protein
MFRASMSVIHPSRIVLAFASKIVRQAKMTVFAHNQSRTIMVQLAFAAPHLCILGISRKTASLWCAELMINDKPIRNMT